MKIANARIVITGGARGLGKALAKQLIEKGATVVVSDRDSAELSKTGFELSAITFEADITKPDQVAALAQTSLEELGGLDVWINNAGIWAPPSDFENVDAQLMHKVYEVNVFGTLNALQQAVKTFKAQKRGTIVDIISTSALVGRPHAAIYSSSKHAVKGLHDSLQEELKGGPLTLVGVYPGGIKTDLFNEQRPADYGQFMEADYVATKIVENLEKNSPETELIIKRPGQQFPH